jgi:hypothetical protein
MSGAPLQSDDAKILMKKMAKIRNPVLEQFASMTGDIGLLEEKDASPLPDLAMLDDDIDVMGQATVAKPPQVGGKPVEKLTGEMADDSMAVHGIRKGERISFDSTTGAAEIFDKQGKSINTLQWDKNDIPKVYSHLKGKIRALPVQQRTQMVSGGQKAAESFHGGLGRILESVQRDYGVIQHSFMEHGETAVVTIYLKRKGG